jgi:hypothetical protein
LVPSEEGADSSDLQQNQGVGVDVRASAFFPDLQVAEVSRTSLTVALSHTLRLSISLVKLTEAETDSNASKVTENIGSTSGSSSMRGYERCLSETAISLEGRLLSIFEASQRPSATLSSPAKHAFLSRFPSLHQKSAGSGSDRSSDSCSGGSLLKAAQEGVQRAMWRLHLEQAVVGLPGAGAGRGGGGVRVNWARRADCAEDDVIIVSQGGAGVGSQTSPSPSLVLRMCATCVEVETLAPSPAAPPLLQFSDEGLLLSFLQRWSRSAV